MLTKNDLSNIFGVEVLYLSVEQRVTNQYTKESLGPYGGEITWLTGQSATTVYEMTTAKQIAPEKVGFYDLEMDARFPSMFVYKLTDKNYKRIHPWVEAYRKEY